MNPLIKVATWNANGLANHSQEIKSFIINHNLDLILISETHFTNKTFFRMPQYTVYTTNHPGDTAHGGTAIIIKSNLKHYELPQHATEYLQATNIALEVNRGTIVFSAIYSPPKHVIKQEQYERFFDSLGVRFIAGGDYNAKHTEWASRLTTTRGRELLKAIRKNNLYSLSTGEPTYWPSDRNKIPDLLDFFIIKGIAKTYTKIESCLDLSSDHSPVLLTVSTQCQQITRPPSLCNKMTNWEMFRINLTKELNLNLPLKTEGDIDEATEHIIKTIQHAAWSSTPAQTEHTYKINQHEKINKAIAIKRKLRRNWQNNRTPQNKTKLNRATRELKTMLKNMKNESVQNYLENLSATQNTDYSLWKATSKLKRPTSNIPPIRKNDGTWARNDREKAETFAQHLVKVFTPFERNITQEEENVITSFLESPYQMSTPIKSIKIAEVEHIIQYQLNLKKAPGYDLITGKIIRELPHEGLKMITMLFNAIIRLGYFPTQWKVAQIILVPKPGKPAEIITSYRPISLLPIVSKIFERLLLKRLQPIIINQNLIPDHQFGFRPKHGTIEQIHRVVNVINYTLEEKKFCSAAFLDITQAFDKVWHTGLLYKLKMALPHNFYVILKSYLTDRHFQVKYKSEQTSLFQVSSGVPQGSVLGPILYLLFTADLPIDNNVEMSTFADDTAILASHPDPTVASYLLQNALDNLQEWLQKWRIKVNETKSNHVTFTTRRGNCPPVRLNNEEIPVTDSVKYLGMHIDRRLTWKKHITTKRKQLNLKVNKIYWLIGRKSQLSLQNKLLIYKAILKPVWTYGIQLWGTASTSNIETLQRFQSKTLRNLINAPWYVTNIQIHEDLQIKTVKEEINNYSEKYISKLEYHPNHTAVQLLDNSQERRRLKRNKPLELPYRFSI